MGAINDSDRVVIYTDGACSGNPGPGGWGVVVFDGEGEQRLSGGAPNTTNNIMELTAAIQALESLTRPRRVALYTDSRYVMDGITQWIHNWKKNGWRTAARKPVKNAELWRRLDVALQRHEIEWHWVKGHSNDPGNELADRLARAAIVAQNRG